MHSRSLKNKIVFTTLITLFISLVLITLFICASINSNVTRIITEYGSSQATLISKLTL